MRQHWQKLVGTVVPGGVVSCISALTSGIQNDGTVTVSHPAIYGKKVDWPGLRIVEVRGPGPLPYDIPLQGTGLHWAGRTRCLMENVGQSAPRRAGREKVEQYLVAVLTSGGEKALNDIRD